MTQPDVASFTANRRINVDETYEVKHWAKQFSVRVQQLEAAIEQAGPLVDAVRLHLKDEIHPDNPWYPRALTGASVK